MSLHYFPFDHSNIMRFPDSYIDTNIESSNTREEPINENEDHWYVNALSEDRLSQQETPNTNKFNSINPLIVENPDNLQVSSILDKDLKSLEFQEYINHYKLLDGDKNEAANFYDLENLDLSFIYNESFNKIINLAANGDCDGDNSNRDEFELDEELINIVGMDNMILNKSTKRYRVDHMFLNREQKYELKKYRNRKASKKFRFKKKKKTIGLEKHMKNLIKVCSELEIKLEDLIEDNIKLQKEFKTRTMK